MDADFLMGFMYKKAILLFLLAVMALSLLLVAYYSVYVEPQKLQIENIIVTSDKWPNRYHVKIVQLSDLHIGSLSPARQTQILAAVRAQKPDMIVLTGDYFTTQKIFDKAGTPAFTAELESIMRLISSLSAPHGVWVVRGNHDFSDDKEVGDIFVRQLRQLGVSVLTNQAKLLQIHGQPLYLIGIEFSNFGNEQAAKFPVRTRQDEKIIRSGPSTKNSYTHFYPLQNSAWHDYEYRVRFRMTVPQASTMGLLFYSQYPVGYDQYYRWRWYPEEQRFRFAPHGASVVESSLAPSFAMLKNTWYIAKVKICNQPDRIEMYGKSWLDGEKEPQEWQAIAWDSSANRIQGGTVGLYSNLQGIHEFDDLFVHSAAGDTLLFEDMQAVPNGGKPNRWVDYNWNQQAFALFTGQVPDSVFSLLLTHRPDYVNQAVKTKIDLQLSGHTHGGQIYLPWLGAPWVHVDKGQHLIRGLFHLNKTTLYVNRGIGTIFLPARFCSPPEITVIHLQGTR